MPASHEGDDTPVNDSDLRDPNPDREDRPDTEVALSEPGDPHPTPDEHVGEGERQVVSDVQAVIDAAAASRSGDENVGDTGLTYEQAVAVAQASDPEAQLARVQDAGPKESEVDATPAAEELAEEEGVDLSEVEGTGAGGRVTKPDVEAAVEEE
jgi:pyruvate/2-oxoglutarate dehydrogenase complex dihydrolipoamide acyltransferase (E2) component